ncbi:MAG: FapA family protein [Spirochaetaceae bacterium]|jgi:uncharacterized protein (DUF342 family)|nr:FapA family protein [Spirochaetaceae bacterium]
MSGSSHKFFNKITLSSTQQDARIVLNFSDDDMEVYADFFPAASKGVPLNIEYAKNLLGRLNITYGIFWDHIEHAIEECNSTGKKQSNVLIARGDIPVDESSAYFSIEENVRKPKIPKFEAEAPTNYRAFSPYIIVQKGQTLATERNAVIGISGRTVHGISVPFKILNNVSVLPGKNTYSDGKKIYADLSGQLLINNNVLDVDPVLNINGVVGYATGNINFPGDAVIQGEVNDGFQLNIGGSLTVRETLDVTDVIVRNDLSVKGGMIGRGRALVKVSGNIQARFVQNCRIACKKTVNVTAEIINSTIYTMESVNVSDKGMIMSGEIYSFHSVTAGKIGKESNYPVKIHLGTDWTLKQEMEQNENIMRIITAKLEKIRSYFSVSSDDNAKASKIEQMRKRLSNEYEKCLAKKDDFEKRYVIDTNAHLDCVQTLAANTIIDICGIEFIAERPLCKSRLLIDKNLGRIVPQPLS